MLITAEQHSIALNQRYDKKLHIDRNMLSSVSFVFWCLVKLKIAWRGRPLWRAIAIFPYLLLLFSFWWPFIVGILTPLITCHLQRIQERENWLVVNKRYHLRWAFNKKKLFVCIWKIKDKTPTIFIMYLITLCYLLIKTCAPRHCRYA